MKSIVKKLGLWAQKLSKERGNLILFALVLPEDTFVWDILISAKWIDEDNTKALKYLAEEVQNILTQKELLNIAGIVLFESDSFSDSFSEVNSETGWEENDIDFYGRHVQKAYIFFSPVEDIRIQSAFSK